MKPGDLVRYKNCNGTMLKVIGRRGPWIIIRGIGRDYEVQTFPHNLEAVKCYAYGKTATEIVEKIYLLCSECAELHREGNRKAVKFAKVWAAK